MNQEVQKAAEEDIRKYLELKDQLDSITVQIDTIRANIENYMDELDAEQIVLNGVGKFVKESKRTWEYTENIKLIEEDLKKQKKEQQQKGLATYKEDSYIKFYTKS